MNPATMIFLTLVATTLAGAQGAYVPKTGSAERQAVCDAMRAHVIKRGARGALPQPIVFKIERIKIQGAYCSFQAVALFKDGSDPSPNYLPDIVYETCLRQAGKEWKVVYDLSRTDVPGAAEMKRIKREFPKDFPVSLLDDFWRGRLQK